MLLMLALALPVAAQNVSPDSGTAATQTFTVSVPDTNGGSDVTAVWLQWSRAVATFNTCYVYYFGGNVYMLTTSGQTLVETPFAGKPLTSQSCTLNSVTATPSASGLTLTLALSFSPTYEIDAYVWVMASYAKQPKMSWTRIGAWSTYCHDCSFPAQYDPAGIYMANTPNWGNCAPYLTRFTLDSNGIPLVSDTYKNQPILYYNVVTIAQVGLHYWGCYYQTGNTDSLAVAVRMGNWLVANQDVTGSISYTQSSAMGIFPDLIAPWGSAMAQGQTISLLTRLYQTTGNPAYLTTAENALRPLQLTVAQGGLTENYYDWQGIPHPYFEEYPSNPPSFTLNGFIFTLIGLYDLSAYSSDAQTLFQQGIETLHIVLPIHDMGAQAGIVSYDLAHITMPPNSISASAAYTKVVVQEIGLLTSVLPQDKILSYYFKLWCNYSGNLN